VVQQGTSGLRAAVGTPDQIRAYLRRYEECGVDQVIFASQTGNNRHEHVMESLELLGREVLPEFIEREAKREARKRERLAPAIERALARKPAADHPPLPSPDYEFPALPRSEADRSRSDEFHRWLDDYARKVASGEDICRHLA
jgi:hypothetical protein